MKRFRRIERALHEAGYEEDIWWAEQLTAPLDADDFARTAIYVVVNSGMSWAIANKIYERCMRALQSHGRVGAVFGHEGKVRAIKHIWRQRQQLFEEFTASNDPLAFCEALPWIGPITKWHLAKDLGIDVAKPDVHLARLARRDKVSVERLCRRLALETGYRVATIDTVLWRTCATGILNSRLYEAHGWRAAFHGRPKIQH